jgi:hypothetical protein
MAGVCSGNERSDPTFSPGVGSPYQKLYPPGKARIDSSDRVSPRKPLRGVWAAIDPGGTIGVVAGTHIGLGTLSGMGPVH